MSSEQLQEAYRLIREGRRQEATQILLPIVRAEPLNADAWWLLANAVESREQKRGALEKVLELRPDDQRARQAYERRRAPEPEKRKNDDYDFPADADVSSRRKRQSSGANPVTLLLAVIGLIAVVGCALCLIATLAGGSFIGRVFQEVVLTITYVPDFGTLAVSFGTPVAATLSDDVNQRGGIEPGQTVRASVDTFTDDSWTFRANAGTSVVIELNATDRTLDPQLYLYNSDRQLINENDDIDMGDNNNSRLELVLPYTGTYTILVSAFGEGGDYELTLRQR